MTWLSILAAAVAPGIALLSYFYLKDRYETEPISMVARMFLAGMLLVFPIMVLQRALVVGFGEQPFLYSFGISAGIEEFFKWFVLYYLIFKHVVFDEPYDGIVYGVAVSLGFATLENVFYAFYSFTSLGSLMFRAFLPVSGHALFGVMMGYYLGKAKFQGQSSSKYLFCSLLFPVFYHGLFDYMMLRLHAGWIWLMVPLMAAFWARGLWTVNKANSRSPFRVLKVEEEIKF